MAHPHVKAIPTPVLVGSLLAIVACGGRGAAFPDEPSGPSAKPMSVAEAKAIDTDSLPTHRFEFLGIEVTSEAFAKPEVKVEVDAAGAQAATAAIPIAAGRAPILCLANEHPGTFGVTLRQFFSGVLKNHPMRAAAQEFAIQGDAAHPMLRFDAIFTTPEKSAAPFQIVYAPMSTRTGLCVLEGMSHPKTLLRVAKQVLTPLSNLEPKSAYSDLRVVKVDGVPIGFEWLRYFDRGTGQYTYQDMTGSFGLSREGLMFMDAVHEGRTDDKGRLLRAETQTLTNQGKSATVFERTDKGAIYTKIAQGREQRKDIAQMPTSDLEDSRAFRRVQKGDKKVAPPTFPDDDGKVMPIAVSRESETTLLLKYKDDVSRCELDEGGRCSKRTTGNLVRERISQVGSFPRLP